MKLQVPKLPLNVPWFLYDIDNGNLITSTVIPGDITDSKAIMLNETQIPGLGYQPVTYGGLGNRKVSFSIPLIKRDGAVGNTYLLKQLEMLRNPKVGFFNFGDTAQWVRNPKVLYYWGTGSIPLVWFVTKCDFTHKQHFTNAFGMPMYTDCNIELTLDEANPLNRSEAVFRQVMAKIGSGIGVADQIESQIQGKRPY